MRKISIMHGSIMYLNSSDWVENLTALEYNDGAWKIYKYNEEVLKPDEDYSPKEIILSNNELFENMIPDFNLMAIK